jgi:hypothetical protein
MSDFEQRLTDALSAGSEGAPDGTGLAQGARGKARVRRRRLAVAGGVAAVLAIAVPTAVVAGGDDSGGGTQLDPATDPADRHDDILVSCGGEQSWPVSAMVDGIPNDIDEAEIRSVFGLLEAEMGIDAPSAIQEHGADRAPYVVLADDGDEIVLGVGRWTIDGPVDDADVVTLTRGKQGLEATGWGDCNNLAVALAEGRSQVEVTAPDGGVDPATTAPEILVTEVQCSSGRDPQPYLGAPKVVEEGDRVLVSVTSEKVNGAANCIGNLPVPLTIELEEPIGDRELVDAGTWPPTPIPVSEWQTIAEDDARAEIPSGWREVECDFDGFIKSVYGPSDGDPCEFGVYAVFQGSANFDAAVLPGVVTRTEVAGEESWTGYVSAGDWVVDVSTKDRELTLRILASARVDDAPMVIADSWETAADRGFEWQFPIRWGVAGGTSPSYGIEVEDRPGGESVEQSVPEQLDDARVRMYADIGDHRITVTAPTQAVAELVLSSVGVDRQP